MDNEADDAVGGSRPGMVKQDGGRLMKVTAAAISSEHSVEHQVAIPVWKRQEHGGASYRRRVYFGAPAQDIRLVNQDHAVVEAVSDEPYQTVESRMAFLLWRPCAVRALQDCEISRPVRFLKVTEETVTGDVINLKVDTRFFDTDQGNWKRVVCALILDCAMFPIYLDGVRQPLFINLMARGGPRVKGTISPPCSEF